MDNNTYLSMDIGSQHTRAWLFDNRSGSYEILGSATAQTTLAAGTDIQTGVLMVLDQIQKTSGYQLLDYQQQLIIGKSEPDRGVTRVGLSLSAGHLIRTALVGVSDSYSLAALRRLVNFFYTEVVLEVNLQDDINATAQLEKMISTDVDLYVVAGGIEGGATRSVKAAIDNIRIVYQSLPKVVKPQIIFAGNSELAEYAGKEWDAGEDFHLAGNIQPGIGKESLSVAWLAMLEAFARIRTQQIHGLADLQAKCGTKVIPTAFAMGRIVRLLDQINPAGKGVLALDVGSGSTTLMA
ncbi:MAG: glutamate mutase L, partial [Anaerolineaceae bacterium]